MATPASTLTMFRPDTGEAVQVDPKQAGDLFRSGQATFAADQDIPVVGADGRLTTIKGADAGDFFTSVESLVGGAASQAQLARQQAEDTYGGLGGTLAAGAAGLARGASAGLSDVALTQLGLVDPGTLKALEDVNPLTSGLTEGLGLVGAVAASGGSRAAGGVVAGGARALAAPTRAISAAGRLAETGAASLLGEGVAARVAASGVGAAVEGSLFGVGQAASRASIDNVDLTAERLLAAGGHGALLGGLLGGGLTAAGALVRGGAGKGAELGADLLGKIEPRAAQLSDDLLSRGLPKTEAAARVLASEAEREVVIRAIGADARAVEKLGALGRDVEQRVLRQYTEDLSRIAGKGEGVALRTAEERAAAATRLADDAAAKVDALAAELAATGEKVALPKITGDLRAKLAAESAAAISPEAQKIAQKADGWLTSLETKVGDDLGKLLPARKELAAELAAAGEKAPAWQRDLAAAIDAEVARVGQAAEGKLGPGWSAQWANARAESQAAHWLSEALAGAKTAPVPIFEEAAKAGLGALASGGGLAGLPLAVGGTLVGVALKRYGADVAAQLARAVSRGEVVHTLDRTVERVAGEKVAKLVGVSRDALSTLPKAAPGAGEVAARALDRPEAPRGSVATRYRAAREELLTSRATLPGRAAQMARDLDGVHPGLGQAVAAGIQRGSDFLASKLPQVPERPSLQPHLDRRREPSFSEMEKFSRYAEAVNDPLAMLRKGTDARPEHVEAVKAVYPSLYQAWQAQVMEAVQSKGSRLGFEERMRLGRLFDLPTDPCRDPAAGRAYQAIQTTAPPPNRPPQQGDSPGPRPSPVPLRVPSLAPRTDQIGAPA